MLNEFEFTSRILIVTADPDISNVLGVLLNNLNYEIELINSGSEAIEQLNSHRFDLMLIDAVLPDINVFQVLSYIKKSSHDTFVIVMLGGNNIENTGECLRSGAYDYLIKTFSKEEIQKRIENALEQKKQEKEIRKINSLMQICEKRYSFVQESDDIVYTLDYDGNFTSINNALQSKLGYENNTLLRKHFSTIIYPEDLQKAKYVFNERRTNTRDQKLYKLRLVKKNGKERNNDNYITVEVKAKGIYDKDLEHKDKLFLGTYGIARDITDFIKNEEVLKLQKSYFNELFNNSNNAIVIIDTNFRILNANAKFEKLFKYNQQEIKNKSIHDLLVPDDMKEVKSITESIRMMETFISESKRKDRNGKYIDVMVYGNPISYNGKHLGAYLIFKDIAELKHNEEELNRSLSKVRGSLGSIANAMVSTVEVRDPYTVGHQQGVSNLARAIAKELGLSREKIDAIRLAGTLHDLGKVNIPAEILSKPNKLSAIELNLIKMHPTIAYEILKRIEFPWDIAEIVYQHHERLDGSGYPLGLKGNDILLSSKIVAVADVVESISSHRPYRPALGIKKALEEISRKKNIWYDGKVVDACVKLFYEKNFSIDSDLPEDNLKNAFRIPA